MNSAGEARQQAPQANLSAVSQAPVQQQHHASGQAARPVPAEKSAEDPQGRQTRARPRLISSIGIKQIDRSAAQRPKRAANSQRQAAADMIPTHLEMSEKVGPHPGKAPPMRWGRGSGLPHPAAAGE